MWNSMASQKIGDPTARMTVSEKKNYIISLHVALKGFFKYKSDLLFKCHAYDDFLEPLQIPPV